MKIKNHTKMERKEKDWDKLLHIDTCGREDYQEDKVHFPYEPTPYVVLKRLAESGLVNRDDAILDYGCGKGRVLVFLAREIGCGGFGIEYDLMLYQQALDNIAASSIPRISIMQGNAETCIVPEDITRCFFFNPFSESILRRVLDRIQESYYRKPREILLFFYYPNEEHVALLMTRDELMFSDEIDCSDLFPGNDARERILVFEVCG